MAPEMSNAASQPSHADDDIEDAASDVPSSLVGDDDEDEREMEVVRLNDAPETAPEAFVDEDVDVEGQKKGDLKEKNEGEQKERPTLRRGEPSTHSIKLGTHQQSLEDRASCLGLWFLTYLNPLLKLGSTKVLESEDIGVPSERDRAGPVFQRAHELWAEECKRTIEVNKKRKSQHEAKLAQLSPEKRGKAKKFVPKEPSVPGVLGKGFGRWRIALAISFYIVSALLQFVPVLLLEDLVKYFETGAYRLIHPWASVVGLAVVPAIITLLQTRSQALFLHLAVYVRTAVSTLLYEKSLGVSAAGRAATSTGQVVNMMSNDTTQLQRFLQFGGMTLVAPIQIIIALVLIYQQVGNATWVGVAFMVSLAPVNVAVFSVVGKQRRKVLKFSDLRVKTMNEILAGVRIIKFYAWEKPFGKEVGKVREKELQALTKLAYTSAVGFSLILLSAPIIQPILVFLTYINIQDDPLTASTAFTTVALFNIMRFPFAFLPMGMLQFIQSRISLRRLGKYLRLPELEPYVLPESPPDNANVSSSKGEGEIGSISMSNCSFAWVHPERAVTPLEDRNAKKKEEKRGSNGGDMNASRRGSRLSLSRRSSRRSQGDEDGAGRGSLGGTTHSGVSLGSDIEGSQRGADPVTLKDISLNIAPGSLVAVVGTVGSGKSSLLSAILGEMEPLDEARVYLPRDDLGEKVAVERTNFVSYCSQTPWVVNDTLRGNILFGRPFHQARYDQVVKACALVDDLSVLPAGDATEIGEKGINLSGGQKARVSLARALYSSDARVLLLDDPLSAVDAHVGEHLFKEAISGQASKGMTTILVTHHVHVLPRCDKVLVMEGGRIQHQGTYQELIDRGVDFAGAVDVTKKEEDDKEEKGDKEEKKDGAKTEEMKAEKSEKKDGEDGGKGSAESLKRKGEEGGADKGDGNKKASGALVKKEEREEGAVVGSLYLHYARAGGLLSFISLVFIQGLGRGAEIMASFWLSLWAERAVSASMRDDPMGDDETTWHLNIYAAFGMLSVACLTGRSVVMAVHRLHASRKLHENLVSSVLRAPVAFFDVTPTGRILGRFAADMDKIDLDLTQSIGQGFSTIFSVLGALGAIVAATKGTFLIPLAPISYVYYVIQKWFRRTSTELQRVTAIAISPIFADFSQVLSGTSTIRAYGGQDRFFKKCQSSFDSFNASYNLQQMCNFWLGLRLDILGGCIGGFIGAIAVATSSANFIPAGWLGLALSYAIEVTGYLKHGVRMIAQVEADMNSVERVLFYSDNIDSEAPDVIPGKDPVGEWPSKGKVEIKHASMRYRDGPLVLKDITLTVKGGEKIGVVGRTGSGKSSLMNLLFRITEPEPDGGKVIIDGVDTSQIGTEALRLNLSIIPQDPVMFSNSVRYNLDPFGSSTDEQLWDVLRKVQLAEVIAALPQGLEDQVAEGGENFSQGQRQLLCIARSLLRNPKILVMDEATASIDNATDAMIQSMIRENFSDATVLTIAHRLGTIMDSDRVLVLDDGRIAEFDSPKALLEMEGGIFRAMVEKSREAHGTEED